MKPLKAIFALALLPAFLFGCSKSTTNTNSSNTSSNTKASSSPATTTSTPATASTTGSSSDAGQTYTHAEGGIQFTAPAGWKSKNEGDSMTLSTPDDSLSVVFWVPAAADFDKAIDSLGDELEKVIKNSKMTSPGQTSTHNGMPAYTAAGTGEVNNEQIAWEVDMLKAKKPVVMLTFAAPAEFEKHEREYKNLVDSIKKVE